MPTDFERELLTKSRIQLVKFAGEERRRLVLEDKVDTTTASRIVAAVIVGMGRAISKGTETMKAQRSLH